MGDYADAVAVDRLASGIIVREAASLGPGNAAGSAFSPPAHNQIDSSSRCYERDDADAVAVDRLASGIIVREAARPRPWERRRQRLQTACTQTDNKQQQQQQQQAK
jgi:hypothetical protein